MELVQQRAIFSHRLPSEIHHKLKLGRNRCPGKRGREKGGGGKARVLRSEISMSGLAISDNKKYLCSSDIIDIIERTEIAMLSFPYHFQHFNCNNVHYVVPLIYLFIPFPSLRFIHYLNRHFPHCLPLFS